MSRFDTCSLCPRLCRTACPVATGSAREAAVPTQIAGVLRDWERGAVPADAAREAATLCVDCGACQDLCHLHRPLPEALREARARLVTPRAPDAVGPVEGTSSTVAIETDARAWGAALSRRLGRPVARLRTRDALGLAALEGGRHGDHFERVAARLRGLDAVVAHGGVAKVLEHLGLSYRWLHEVVPLEGAASCCTGRPEGMACCGAAEPLATHHPDDARRVGAHWLRRTEVRTVLDARCGAHLRAIDDQVRDGVDRLMEGA